MLTGEKYILVNNCIFRDQGAISVEYCPLIFKLIISCFRFWCLFLSDQRNPCCGQITGNGTKSRDQKT